MIEEQKKELRHKKMIVNLDLIAGILLEIG